VTFSNTITDDTALPFTGEWIFENDSSLSLLDSTYHTTTNAGDFVDFNFTGAFVSLPVFHLSNYTLASLSLGTAVTIFGFRDANSGRFTVRLDNDSVTFNAASSTKEATTLFFRTGLNNSIPHTLTITNDDDNLLAIGLINVTLASSNS
jgi:hypothetical protein